MTPPDIWGGGGFEVHDAMGDDGEVEMGAVPRWHVMVNGVGAWPVAYFYEQGDAELWSQTMNATFGRGPIGG